MNANDEFKRGTFWLGSATIIARLVDVTATLAIVGLLTQKQMGLGALVLSASAILESLSGIGIGGALIQAKEISREEESSLFWITSAIGLALGLILVALAPILAGGYEQPALLPLVAVSGLKLFLVGISLVPLQLLSKRLQFREIGVVQTLASIGEGVTKIVLAFGGAGAWALIVGNLMRGVILLVALCMLSTFRPQFHFAFRETRRFLRFGLHLAGSSVLYQVYKNADYFLVGKVLGLDALGLYRVAFDVAMQPTDAIIALVGRVGFPMYSRLATDLPALRATFLANTRSLFLMVAPVATFIFFAGGDVLQILGRERWVGSVEALQILVWAGLMRAAAVMFSQVYIAIGRPQYAVLESALTSVILIGSFWIGLTLFPELGVLSVSLAWLIVYPLFVTGHLLLMRRLVALKPVQYLRAVASGLGPGPWMLLGLYLLGRWIGEVGGWRKLGAFAVVMLAIYAAYLRWVLNVRWRELVPKQSARSITANE